MNHDDRPDPTCGGVATGPCGSALPDRRSKDAQPDSQPEEASPWWKPPGLNAPEPPPVEDETPRALQERLVAGLAVEAALVQEAQARLKTAPNTPVPPALPMACETNPATTKAATDWALAAANPERNLLLRLHTMRRQLLLVGGTDSASQAVADKRSRG